MVATTSKKRTQTATGKMTSCIKSHLVIEACPQEGPVSSKCQQQASHAGPSVSEPSLKDTDNGGQLDVTVSEYEAQPRESTAICHSVMHETTASCNYNIPAIPLVSQILGDFKAIPGIRLAAKHKLRQCL